MLGKKKEKLDIEIKLEKLYLLNKKDPEKLNDNLIKLVADQNLLKAAYGKIQSNKSAMTVGVDEKDIVDGFNRKLVEDISKSILNETYEWKDIKQIMIPKPGKKKKRPLGMPTFSDKLVQECIRIVLMAIYEPNFQMIEANHGFRPHRSTHSVIDGILTKGQGMEYALEGDISSAYNSLRHKKLMKLLKKRINDKKFLRLIEKGLKHSIQFDEKRIKNILGVPQGAILSPLLFNIYMHEFDLEIEKVKKEIEARNIKEKRLYKAYTRVTNKYRARVRKLGKDLDKKLNDNDFTQFDFKKLIKKTEATKKQLLALPSKDKAKTLLKIYYCRYADDWIIFTNLKEKGVIALKERLTIWLKDNLYFELDQEKTYITNLRKGKAKFLGFTLFLHKKNITRKKTKTGRIFRQRSGDRIYLGIDHERVKNRMKDLKMIDEKLNPRHVGLYCSLKPWEIVEKFYLKTLGLLSYYYPHLPSPSDLSYYYYVFRYSCLKTLSFRLKISMAQVSKIYGENLEMKKVIKIKDKITGMIKEKEFTVSFPNYMNIMNQVGDRVALDRIVKTPKTDTKTFINGFESQPIDSLDTFNISINTRTGTKVDKVCCVYGTEGTRNNPIEMHHIKHIKKGVVTGFSEIMKSLNRKHIPICRQCHRRIHRGDYNGLSFSDLHSLEVAY